MPPCVVLDKCYLQSVSAERLRSLADSAMLVMTDALFYELLTTDPITRSRCFSKFPDVEVPVHLVGHIGPMLLHEQNTHTKAEDFLSYEIAEPYRFNLGLRDASYELPSDALRNVSEEAGDIRNSVSRYVERTESAASMFPLVTQGSDFARSTALSIYEQELSQRETILGFYRSVHVPGLPPPDLLSEGWATFRLYQVSLFFSLHTLHRHRGPVPPEPSVREFTRLEHDVHDCTMLLAAVMAGAFATKEQKLKRWWHLLCPEGPLYVS
jgi:hypothetical protein